MTCGTPLVTPTPPMPPPVYGMPQPAPYPYYGYPAGYWEYQRMGRIDNTKTGLLLMIIGISLSWIPFIGGIGGLVAIIGALLVIIGREAFGREHARNAILALILFFAGIGVTIAGFFGLFFGALYYTSSPGSVAYASLGILIIIGGGVTGLSEVFITYALQMKTGRILLWTAYAAAITISIVNFLIILQIGAGFLLFPAMLLTAFLGVIPAVLYAVAYYLARERIVRREIPGPFTQPPPMPAYGGPPPATGPG
jgi:drug/metabolite transporter (DMT)-like permease